MIKQTNKQTDRSTHQLLSARAPAAGRRKAGSACFWRRLTRARPAISVCFGWVDAWWCVDQVAGWFRWGPKGSEGAGGMRMSMASESSGSCWHESYSNQRPSIQRPPAGLDPCRIHQRGWPNSDFGSRGDISCSTTSRAKAASGCPPSRGFSPPRLVTVCVVGRSILMLGIGPAD